AHYDFPKGVVHLSPSPPLTLSISANARSQKHRDKLREQHCRRLEVWIESGVVEDLRTIASYRGVPLRQMVREAFQCAVTSYAGVLEVLKRDTARASFTTLVSGGIPRSVCSGS